MYLNILLYLGGTPWLKNVPWGLRKALVWIKENYNDPEIIVTENGFAIEGEDKLGPEEALNDTVRVEWLRGYVNEMLNAVHIHNVKVNSYAHHCHSSYFVLD